MFPKQDVSVFVLLKQTLNVIKVITALLEPAQVFSYLNSCKHHFLVPFLNISTGSQNFKKNLISGWD